MTGSSVAQKQDKARLGRDDWLIQALELLGETGDPNAIRIDALCQRLGVTKGSFYWHFKGRDDLVDGIIDYWADRYHAQIHAGFGVMPQDDPHGFLAAITQFWASGNFSATDAALRQWAKGDVRVAEAIASADTMVTAQFVDMFQALGFSEQTAKTRAVILLSLGVAAPYIGPIVSSIPSDDTLTFLLRP